MIGYVRNVSIDTSRVSRKLTVGTSALTHANIHTNCLLFSKILNKIEKCQLILAQLTKNKLLLYIEH